MTKQQAWLALAKAWRNPCEDIYGNWYVTIGGGRSYGLCSSIAALRVSETTKNKMRANVKQYALLTRQIGFDYRWAFGRQSALARARFCERMAAMCGKKRKVKRLNDTCPKCGAELVSGTSYAWQCGSTSQYLGKGYQSQLCRIRELEREVERLRAATVVTLDGPVPTEPGWYIVEQAGEFRLACIYRLHGRLRFHWKSDVAEQKIFHQFRWSRRLEVRRDGA